jgi:hypothetical protein
MRIQQFHFGMQGLVIAVMLCCVGPFWRAWFSSDADWLPLTHAFIMGLNNRLNWIVLVSKTSKQRRRLERSAGRWCRSSAQRSNNIAAATRYLVRFGCGLRWWPLLLHFFACHIPMLQYTYVTRWRKGYLNRSSTDQPKLQNSSKIEFNSTFLRERWSQELGWIHLYLRFHEWRSRIARLHWTHPGKNGRRETWSKGSPWPWIT